MKNNVYLAASTAALAAAAPALAQGNTNIITHNGHLGARAVTHT